jgi:secreted trypsin-like serine protease
MFFTEEDLVSFGSYLLSDIRMENIQAMSKEETQDIIEQRLKNVSDADLGNWAYLVNKAKEQSETKSENPYN